MQGLRADDSSHTGSVLQDLTYSINDAPVLMPQTLILLKKFPEELSHFGDCKQLRLCLPATCASEMVLCHLSWTSESPLGNVG